MLYGGLKAVLRLCRCCMEAVWRLYGGCMEAVRGTVARTLSAVCRRPAEDEAASREGLGRPEVLLAPL